jgi:hypothetical protein
MNDVMCLIDGVGTEVLTRKVALGEVRAGHEDRCFSLVTTTRTFDLEALSVAQRRVLVRAFNFLVKHLNRRPAAAPITVHRSGSGSVVTAAGRSTPYIVAPAGAGGGGSSMRRGSAPAMTAGGGSGGGGAGSTSAAGVRYY